MQALVMDLPLTLTRILERARRLYHDTEVVTKTARSVHRYTYGDMYARCCRLANVLGELGVGPGDRVASVAWNTHRHLELYFAVPGVGAILHTINARLSPAEIAYVVDHAGDQVLFVDDSLLEVLEPLRDELRTVRAYVVMGDGPRPASKLDPLYSYEELLASTTTGFDWPELDERTACGLSYTSGTTGRPKGVTYSHRGLFLQALAHGSTNASAIGERDVVLPLASMFHAAAWALPYGAVLAGAKLVFPGRDLSPAAIAQLVAAERVTFAAGVPTLWFGLVEYLREYQANLSSLRTILSGGSAVPPKLIQDYDALGIELLHAWGMTETSALGSTARLRAHMDEWSEDAKLAVRSTVGYPVPHLEVRAVDEQGHEVPWDGQTVGEIQVRGPAVIGDYYRDDRGPGSFDRGWLRTGDVGTIDPHGYIRILDRVKDLVKSGGEWISSVDLENAIMAHPDVLESAVIAVPHEKWQERPLACVVPRPGANRSLTAETILNFLRPQFAKWSLPDAVLFLDAIPKTSVGKFDKKVLRERYRHALATRS